MREAYIKEIYTILKVKGLPAETALMCTFWPLKFWPYPVKTLVNTVVLLYCTLFHR